MQGFKQDDTGQEQKSGDISIPVEELSDETLIRAIAVGVIKAMELLYQRYYRLLYAIAYRMVADHQLAEDLLQESFFSVWRSAGTYSAQAGSVRRWLISIIRNRTISHLRSTRARSALKATTLDELEYDEASASPDVWDEAWRSVQGAQVREALLRLTSEQRTVIELAYFQGWTQSEIADGYHIPLGTVKARMRLGLLHLKRILEQMGVHER
ncbi:MAG: sigma-70 family RNA polymerase sigma factor [Ktedonobacteraceae bacterium]|nr:sigma-70 family RNA polymerase sigma factor [Ktedonobacteraceae bacterium]